MKKWGNLRKVNLNIAQESLHAEIEHRAHALRQP